MWHFIADLHLGHSNIIKYCKRPFMSPQEEGLLSMIDHGTIPTRELRISQASTERMDSTIINSINSTVLEDDTLVIGGDFCWSTKDARVSLAQKFRNQINCKNVFLIWGNHDDRNMLSHLFTACYDQYDFNVNGQHVFMNHYPCRSWDKSHYGAWMLYGHVHDLYSAEDNGGLMPYEKQVLTEGFDSVLNRLLPDSFGISEKSDIVKDLLAVCASLNGIDLTLDIGVDNRIRGESVPFGTPWSMNDIRAYMDKKKARWFARQEAIKQLQTASSLKSGK